MRLVRVLVLLAVLLVGTSTLARADDGTVVVDPAATPAPLDLVDPGSLGVVPAPTDSGSLVEPTDLIDPGGI